MPVVFISHSYTDKPFVDALFDLLQTGYDLRRDEIFCTSVESAGIKTGADFVDWIKEYMTDAALVLLVLSPNYYASTFCAAEMGAAWALEKTVFPMMLPRVGRDPGVVFLGRQSAVVNQSGLDDLRDAIAEHHPDVAKATSRWTLQRDAFLGRSEELLARLHQPDLVDRTLLEEQQRRANAAAELFEESEVKVRGLQERVVALEDLKDAVGVAELSARLDSAVERYDAAVVAARLELKELDRVEQRAVYAAVSGDDWYPSHETWEYWNSEIERAVRSKWLTKYESPSGDLGYIANMNHPSYASVDTAIYDLRAAIERIPDETRKRIESSNGYLVSITNQQFWEEVLLEHGMLD